MAPLLSESKYLNSYFIWLSLNPNLYSVRHLQNSSIYKSPEPLSSMILNDLPNEKVLLVPLALNLSLSLLINWSVFRFCGVLYWDWFSWALPVIGLFSCADEWLLLSVAKGAVLLLFIKLLLLFTFLLLLLLRAEDAWSNFQQLVIITSKY